MANPLVMLFRVLANMITALFKRGRGIFKFLFVIDDLFRIFTMTLLIPILFDWIGLNDTFIALGVILGLVIDIHDFVTSSQNYEVLEAIRKQ